MENEHIEMFERLRNYKKKGGSEGKHLNFLISPSEFLRTFFGTSLRFQIREYNLSTVIYWGFDGFTNISEIRFLQQLYVIHQNYRFRWPIQNFYLFFTVKSF